MKFLACVALLAFLTLTTTESQAQKKQPEWIARSNQNAMELLRAQAKFAPEFIGRLGVTGLDDQVIDLKPNYRERSRSAVKAVVAEFEHKVAAEKDPRVKQDLEIMITTAQRRLRASELEEKYEFDYVDVPQVIFAGLHGLLDEQVPAERRAAALVRLRKYAGLEAGTTPITALAEQRTRESMKNSSLTGPPRAEVEQQLVAAQFYLKGIGDLFKKFNLAGYEEPLAKLTQEVNAYDDFVRKEVLPRSRTDFRLPPEMYAQSLVLTGIDIAPEELARRAHAAFNDFQQQMVVLAPKVAKEEGLPANTNYRDVIRALKKHQLVGDAILPHYEHRLQEIEQIIRREHLVTLPDRPAVIRLATMAESAQQPAPHMQPPQLVNNHGQRGAFVLPLNAPIGPGGQEQKYDDFTFAAASWTLTSHEARPGHELQFDTMVEQGVSLPRAVFAFNSVNVEGWGLYSEYIMFPFMPPEGQLISLQHRLMRAARAFLDPELQMGKIKPEDAMRVLTQDVVLSDTMAKQEVDRYTFRMPGQAPSYFYGYTKMLQLRADVEKQMGPKFSAEKFHDFVLDQGLLPPELLRKAVMENFVGAK